MKKIVCAAASVAMLMLTLCACGSKTCNMCGKSCTAKYSYRDGNVVLCGSCYKDCFEDKTEVDADAYFAVEEASEEAAEEAAE